MSSFENLIPEILLLIFSQLDLHDVCRLRVTCRKFRDFVDTWDHTLLRPGYEPLVTNQSNDRFLKRCYRKIPTKREKLKIEHNWVKGRYKETALFRSKERYMPCLELTNDFLWLSRANQINCYKRSKRLIETKPAQCWCPMQEEEITKFKIKNGFLVCGHSEGSVSIHSLYDKDCYIVAKSSTVLQEYTSSVDITDDSSLVAAGMRGDCVKFWMIHHNSTLSLDELPKLEFEASRVWSVNFSSDRNMIGIGTGQYSYRDCTKSVFIYDTERFEECIKLQSHSQRKFHETLDLKWDGPHTLWSCGHEELLRWDLRSGQTVQKYCDPFNANFYCMELDHSTTVAVGSNLHGKVTMYDSRKSSAFGMYFMDSCRGDRRRSSPVYSLSFDSEMLFVATDQHLNILNFNLKEFKQKNDGPRDRNYDFWLR